MTPMEKPHAPACDRNQEPILEVLREVLADRRQVLEIGSGTGQHAVHFAAALPHLVWQCSDRAEALPGMRMWLDEAALANTPAPVELDVDGPWPAGPYDAIFTANTLHIMGWSDVEQLFRKLPAVLARDAVVVVYGPFHRGGRPTSESNAAFDALLRSRSVRQGVRDLEAVDALAKGAGLRLVEDRALPANNACLVWRQGP